MAYPAEWMKTNREHRVPLSGRALAVLREARTLVDGSGLVFPSARGRPLSEVVISKMVRDLRTAPANPKRPTQTTSAGPKPAAPPRMSRRHPPEDTSVLSNQTPPAQTPRNACGHLPSRSASQVAETRAQPPAYFAPRREGNVILQTARVSRIVH